MSARIPRVSDGYLEDPTPPGRRLRLESPAWFQWLEADTTTRFTYAIFDPALGYSIGTMTVRKERRQRGGVYWSAYRRAGERLRKIYLGSSSSLTMARLEAVASEFRAAAHPAVPPPR
jgi:LuxR family maltose regulon positive regulatory protein